MVDLAKRLLCFFGVHSWKFVERELGCYGMGLEWFTIERCTRCGCWATQLEEPGNNWSSRLTSMNRDFL